MPTGTCLCGEIKILYTGEPAFTAICHCDDDRRMSNFQTFQVPEQNFTLGSGTPKVYTKVSDSGREINLHFCSSCGTAMYRTGGSPNVKGMVGVRAGVLVDDPLLDEPPKIEVYVEKRPKWRPKLDGAMQLSGKYEIVEKGDKKSSGYKDDVKAK